VIGNDAQLVLRFENAAKPFVEEGNELFGGQPNFFSKFKYPNFSGSQILPFVLQALGFLTVTPPEGACIRPQFIKALPA